MNMTKAVAVHLPDSGVTYTVDKDELGIGESLEYHRVTEVIPVEGFGRWMKETMGIESFESMVNLMETHQVFEVKDIQVMLLDHGRLRLRVFWPDGNKVDYLINGKYTIQLADTGGVPDAAD